MPDERTPHPDKNYRVTDSGRVEVNTTALVYAHLDAQKKTMEDERTPHCAECAAGYPVDVYEDGTRLHVHGGSAITCKASRTPVELAHQAPIETALARIRKERCRWCAAGSTPTVAKGTIHKIYPMNASGGFKSPEVSGPFSEYIPCTAPTAEALVEEFAAALIEQSTPVEIRAGTDCRCGQGFMAHNRCSFCPRCGKAITWK